MGKNKGRKHGKNRQKKATKDAFKKKIQKRATAAVRRYVVAGRKQALIQAKQKAEEDKKKFPLDRQISFAHCEGVGECCKNRPIFVEPTDVWRIMQNERAREKFGLKSTIDLYGNDEKPGPLIYRVDKKSLMPFCAVHRVELLKTIPDKIENPGVSVAERDQVCPFFEFREDGVPECILGPDRFTQCSSDPLNRIGRVEHGRRLAGWEYTLVDEPCIGCKQAAEDKERNMLVKDWLKARGMEDRYIESDLFHGLLMKLRDEIKQAEGQAEFLWRMATIIMFDWHLFGVDCLRQPIEEVIEHGPESPKEVFLLAHEMVKGVISGSVSIQSERESDGDGDDETEGQAEES